MVIRPEVMTALHAFASNRTVSPRLDPALLQ